MRISKAIIVAGCVVACSSDSDPCADHLGSASLAKQKCDPPGVCDQLAKEPSRLVAWYLHVDSEVTDSSAMECLLSHARRRGLSTRQVLSGVSMEASYADAATLLEFDIVETAEVSCAGQYCEECRVKAPEECGSDLLCQEIEGQLIDEESDCLGPFESVGCKSAAADGGAAITEARSPDGQCWVFPDTSVPLNWEVEGVCQFEYDSRGCP